MPAEAIPRLFAQLRRPPESSDADGDLVGRFVRSGDQAAFAGLVRRHAGMVLGVCRRVLGNHADAEDACQATFLILVRKARSIRPRGNVGGWLHGVARNTARRARQMSARRQRRELLASRLPRPVGSDSDLRDVIDREVAQLPERYRSTVVLCDLEGMTRKEAARHLGCAEGTVASRLSRARQILARRLIRAGLGIPASGAGIVFAAEAHGSPTALVDMILDTAAGRSAAPAAINQLTLGVLRTMRLQRYSVVAAALLAVGIAGLTVREALPNISGQAPPAKSAARSVEPVPVGKDAAPGLTLQNVPPVVVKTIPVAGADDVDPATTEIKVTFSKDMMDESWSWSQISDETFPKSDGDKPIHYEKDKRTCVMKVKLEPGKMYAIWVNSHQFGNFKDAGGQSAIPYLLVFKTKKKD